MYNILINLRNSLNQNIDFNAGYYLKKKIFFIKLTKQIKYSWKKLYFPSFKYKQKRRYKEKLCLIVNFKILIMITMP